MESSISNHQRVHGRTWDAEQRLQNSRRDNDCDQPTYISVPGRYYYREGSKQAITDRLGDTEEAMYLDRARDRWMCDVTIFAVLAGGVTDQIYSRITPRYEWG